MIPEEITALPLYPHLDAVAETLAARRLLMLHAEPGAGKTTLVPWRLLAHPAFAGPKLLLLQPRRIAARAAAERIAALLGEALGRTVGLRTRLETIVGPRTRLEVVTEGVLTRIIQNDPSLSGYGLVIFDEFHERNLQGDVALAFAWECREALRRDLGILFMSATPPAEELRVAIGDFPVLSVPGRTWPVQGFDRPPLRGESPGSGAARLAIEAQERLAQEGGDVLVFLPGFREIRQAQAELLRRRPQLGPAIVILHGSLPPDAQRRVLIAPTGSAPRIILATNVAETSLTIPGVRAVVDSGLERRVRFLPRTGMDHWETVEISEASAVQRRGRAGRLGPGICLRWYDSSEPRRRFAPPEIMEADLAPLVLETALWGAGSPAELTWITPPPPGALKQATALLEELELIDTRGRITDLGRQAAALGLHPRLGRMVKKGMEKGWLATAALTAAMLEEGDPLGGADPDFRDRLSAWVAWAKGERSDLRPDSGRRIAREAERIMGQAGRKEKALRGADIDPALAGGLLLLAYPDRAARRVGEAGPAKTARLVLATGRGAQIKGALGQEEFLVAADLDGGETEARVFLAAPVSRADMESGLAGPVVTARQFSWAGWTLKTRRELRVGKLLIGEQRGLTPAPEEIRRAVRERLNSEGLEALPWNDAARRFYARCLFVGRCGRQETWPDFSSAALLDALDEWLLPFGHWKGGAVFTGESLREALMSRLGWEHRRTLDTEAPETWLLPSGTRKGLDYETGEAPVIAARLQEFFGCRETPRLCGRPLTLHLLSPAGRPVQITQDLDGFWERSYPAVKKELMGRYPRHFWPDDPRTAEPSARAKKKGV
ncbi:MAG: ATP-dependent helicase HrpB [Deltaproteobacteria bacterium]|nr:ATP-dependent helicase HrpB [Deltaproteobacteria bacterium]